MLPAESAPSGMNLNTTDFQAILLELIREAKSLILADYLPDYKNAHNQHRLLSIAQACGIKPPKKMDVAGFWTLRGEVLEKLFNDAKIFQREHYDAIKRIYSTDLNLGALDDAK